MVGNDGYLSKETSVEINQIFHKNAVIMEPVRHGRWIFKEDLVKWGYPYLCTVCNKAHNYQEKYCPNCGAKMDKE